MASDNLISANVYGSITKVKWVTLIYIQFCLIIRNSHDIVSSNSMNLGRDV